MKMLPDVIKVLHLIDQYRIGGPGKTIINSAKFIDGDKFHIHAGTFAPEGRLIEFQEALLRVEIPLFTLTDSRGLRLSTLKRLCNYIRENNIDILHTHGYKTDMYGFFVKSFLPRLKLISTQHGWITNNVRQRFYVRLDLVLSRFFDGIIVVSEDMLRKLPRVTRSRVPCTMIHNALVLSDYMQRDSRQAVRAEFGIEDNEIAVGVIGRLTSEKGCLEVLEAFTLLQPTNDIRNKLIFVGEGPLLEALQRRIESSSLQNKVTLVGYRNPIQPVYEAIDIVVCPSHTEGLSNVILEAMAYGIPAVATSVGGNPEIVTDGHNGLLVRPHDTAALRDALAKLVSSPSLRKRLGKNGFTTISSYFTFDERIKLVEAFYESVMSAHF